MSELEPVCTSDCEILEDATSSPVTKDLHEQHPWPHLAKFFSVQYWEGNTPVFLCKLCLPRQKEIRGHVSSLQNLKAHIRSLHPSKNTEFLQNIQANSKRGKHSRPKSLMDCVHEESDIATSPAPSPTLPTNAPLKRSLSELPVTPPPPKKLRVTSGGWQMTIGQAFSHIGSPASVPQGLVDQAIVDCFVDNMLPLQLVDSPSFVNLLRVLNDKKAVMSRRTLGRRIEDCFLSMEKKLLSTLETVPYVATTADCWSAQQRAFLGMTVHWIDPSTRMRMFAVLGFVRLTGSHTASSLAHAIMTVHTKFLIADKVIRTTTDNGSNFVKAFVDYAQECGVLPYLPADAIAEDDRNDAVDDNDDDDEPVPVNMETETISVTDGLLEAEDDRLPPHMRCASHTLNLVATADVQKVLTSSTGTPFKTQFRKTMAKAQSLWNAQGRSTVAAEQIKHELGRKLEVPNATRWNSTYNSVKRLCDVFAEGKRAVLNRVMQSMAKPIQPFLPDDVQFLKEYELVTRHVAKSLDILQGESQAYLGVLLPTIAITERKLIQVKNGGLQYCDALADAMLDGIRRRFAPFFDDTDCQLSAAFHPMFRLAWLEKHDPEKVATVKSLMEMVIKKAIDDSDSVSGNGQSSSCTSESEAEDNPSDFFGDLTQSTKPRTANKPTSATKAHSIVQAWVEGAWKSEEKLTDRAFALEPLLMKLFVRYNTPIPSSAAVERLFSSGKDVLRAKRAPLSDNMLSRLLFLRGNRHLK